MTPEEHKAQSDATLKVIHDMEVALGNNSNEMQKYFHEGFRWMGNYGCGTKNNLDEFRNNWQLPLRAAFTDRIYKTDKFLADGEWASCFGQIEATHSGTFMGIKATGKRVTIPYMDFWRVEGGKIADNRVSVDFPSILAQLGEDVFANRGWESFDEGLEAPPKPKKPKMP